MVSLALLRYRGAAPGWSISIGAERSGARNTGALRSITFFVRKAFLKYITGRRAWRSRAIGPKRLRMAAGPPPYCVRNWKL